MRLILASLIAITALLSTGCGPGPETCSAASECTNGGSWQACCNTVECWYALSNGDDIECNGTDCSSGSPSAAEKVVAWCTAD